MNGPMRRVALALFVALLLIALDVTYWQVVAADRLREDPRNTRVLARSARERGQLISSDGIVLALSTPDQTHPRHYVREYPHASLYAHTIGVSSLLFGDTGLEATHADLLTSGSDLTVSSIIEALLGQDLRARFLQLTLNHRLQAAAAQALGGRVGGVVAIEPSTGRVLAMVSSPSFDPNALVGEQAEAAWEALEGDPSRPLDDRSGGSRLLEQEGAAPFTALEMALRAAALAHNGQLMTPYLVARVFDADSTLESETVPTVQSEAFSPEEAALVAESMVTLIIRNEVLGDVLGRGEYGTHQDPAGGRFLWFTGFVPVDEPTLAVGVVIEESDGSLDTAEGDNWNSPGTIPISRAVLAAWLDQQIPAP